MKTVDLTKLATAAPVNKQAALMRDGRGVGPLEKTNGGVILDGPPPIMRYLPDARMVDFTGAVLGSLTVIGVRARQVGDGKHRQTSWVCRCQCGNYTLRHHAKLLLSRADDIDLACPACHYQRIVLRPDRSAGGGASGTISRWTECPPLKPAPPRSLNLEGLRIGSLTVMGLVDKAAIGVKGGGDGRWVVRCDCGNFELRRAKYLTTGQDREQATCIACKQATA